MKLFVWDFHGVLEKGNDRAVEEISNSVLGANGYSQRFTMKEIELLYGKKWFEYFQRILPHEPHETHIKLQEACFEFSNSKPEIIARYIKSNDHATDVLDAINDTHQQILISNTRPDALRMFIASVGLEKYFPSGKYFAADAHRSAPINKNKLELLIEFLEGKTFDSVVVIGDSVRDMELASVANGISYLYALPGKAFPECLAQYKIRDLREVLREL